MHVLIALTTLGLIATPSQLTPQPHPPPQPLCGPAPMIDAGLRAVGEQPVWRGKVTPIVDLVLYARPDGQTWTLVTTNEEVGFTCLVKMGVDSSFASELLGNPV